MSLGLLLLIVVVLLMVGVIPTWRYSNGWGMVQADCWAWYWSCYSS